MITNEKAKGQSLAIGCLGIGFLLMISSFLLVFYVIIHFIRKWW